MPMYEYAIILPDGTDGEIFGHLQSFDGGGGGRGRGIGDGGGDAI